MKILAAAIFVLIFTPVMAQDKIEQAMDFDECLARIRSSATQFATAPVNIIETNSLRIVRFPTTDGSVLMTCSKIDRRMKLEKSKAKCGVNVRC